MINSTAKSPLSFLDTTQKTGRSREERSKMKHIAPQTVASFKQRTTMNEDQSDGRDESIEPAASDSPCDTSNSTPFSPVYSAVAARESASDPGEPQIETR